jgi:alcohol dehydrogenase class IV
MTQEEYFSHIEAMAEGALADGCTATNPRVPTKAEIMEIYKSIW